jgi:hypothetical protein
MILRWWRAWRERVALRREAERQVRRAFWEKFWEGVPDSRQWAVGVLAAGWFGTDAQADYAVRRYMEALEREGS